MRSEEQVFAGWAQFDSMLPELFQACGWSNYGNFARSTCSHPLPDRDASQRSLRLRVTPAPG